jgi:NAD(P)-dependent dehydrogenase (short-subunit alcohol dehydrogenase family)
MTQTNARSNGAVVVTGASSGIGRACALLLANRGFQVFASIRKEAEGQSLQKAGGGNVIPLLLDVTAPDLLASAGKTVAKAVGEAGLVGLVNNAGIGVSGPLEYLALEALRRQFEINVVGQIAVTQTFLPLLRQTRGRVINIGSVGDRITIPFGGALCGSKSAFATLTEALRLELHPWGMHVCLIEPGSIQTPAITKLRDDNEALLKRMPLEGVRLYGDMFRAFTRKALQREATGSPPEVVAEAVYHALTATHPKTRYPVGKDAALLVRLGRYVPDRLLDRLRLKLFGMPVAFGILTASAASVEAKQ